MANGSADRISIELGPVELVQFRVRREVEFVNAVMNPKLFVYRSSSGSESVAFVFSNGATYERSVDDPAKWDGLRGYLHNDFHRLFSGDLVSEALIEKTIELIFAAMEKLRESTQDGIVGDLFKLEEVATAP